MSKSFTSVKVDSIAYEQFKKMSLSRKFYLQDLVNRSMHLFVNDQTFRDTIYNYNIPVLSVESQSTPIATTNTDSQPS
jgi:hypothetical protein